MHYMDCYMHRPHCVVTLPVSPNYTTIAGITTKFCLNIVIRFYHFQPKNCNLSEVQIHIHVYPFPNTYRGSPTCTVSTNTEFSAIGIKFVLVECVISKFVLCTTQLVQISHSKFFPGPKNGTKQGSPVKTDSLTIK